MVMFYNRHVCSRVLRFASSRLASSVVLLVCLTTFAWSEITGALSIVDIPGSGVGTWVARSQLASDGTLFVGYNGWSSGISGTSRVDLSSGAVMFNNPYGQPAGGIEDIALGSGDVFYVSGRFWDNSNGYGQASLSAYTPDGALLWQKLYGAGGYGGQGFARAVDTDPAGNIYVSYTSYFPSPTNNSAIFKYDPSGNLIWTKDFSLDVYQGQAQNDAGVFYLEIGQDGYLYVGLADWVRGHYVVKLDPVSGSEIWSAEFGSPQFGESEYIWEIRQETSGIIYVVGRAYSLGLVTAYNIDGTLLWSRTLTQGDPTSIVQAPDGTLVISTSNGGSAVTLTGLNPDTGATLWDNVIPSDGNLIGGWLEVTPLGKLVFTVSAYDGSATQVFGFPVSVSNLVIQFDVTGQIIGTLANDTMIGGVTNDVISAAAGNDTVMSGSGNDVVAMGIGNDLVIGGTGLGNDSYDGGAGVDTVKYTSALAGINVNLTAGTAGSVAGDDSANIGADTLSNIENVIAGSYGDILRGSTADNSFDGGGGTDRVVLTGVRSDYTADYDSPSGVFTIVDKLPGRDGTDTFVNVEEFQFSDGLKLAAQLIVNVVNGTNSSDTLAGTSGSDELFGLSGNDTLTGLDGDDLLDGGAGADNMAGGAGNDTYIVDSASDIVAEGPGTGNDTVKTTLSSYTLPANVENLIYIGTGTFTGTGNTLANSLTGGANADSLNGSSAADVMTGLGGNDSYAFDNIGDTAIEGVNAGTDRITASISVILSDYIEDLTLTGSANLSGTGNILNNTLNGNSGANVLTGGGGNDILNGGAGADGMYGGDGDDNYTVDNAADITAEDAGKGTDRVSSSVTRILADHLEDLTLTGSANINGTGNSLNNRLAGNTGANILSGAAGEDVLIGGSGNDTFYGNTISTVGTEIDTVSYEGTTAAVTFNLGLTATQATGGSGTDRIPNGSIENLIGSSAADTLTGTTGANLIVGAAGNDRLNGLTGADVLVGNAGLDTIDCGLETTNAIDTVVYMLSSDSAVGTNRDQIFNFKTGDKIDLSATDASTSAAGDQAFTFNTTTAKANSIWYAVSGADVIIRGDVNGNTTPDFEILLKGMTSITAAQFAL